MIKMLEMLCAIPENIGWVIVGFVGCLCFEMFGLLIGTVVNAIKDHVEAKKSEEWDDE